MNGSKCFVVGATLLTCGCSIDKPPVPLSPADQGAALASPIRIIPRDIADEPFPWPLPVTEAETILTSTTVFDTGDVSGRPGLQVHAFNVLLEQPDAHASFRRLATKPGSAARLYALCGVWLIDRQEGRNLAYSLSLATAPVTVRDGDFTFESTIAQTIVRIILDDVPRRLKEGGSVARRFFNAQSRR